MGRPIDEYPLKVLYRIDACLPGDDERWVALLSPTVNRPARQRVEQALGRANGLRAKGSPRITRVRMVEITERIVNEGDLNA